MQTHKPSPNSTTDDRVVLADQAPDPPVEEQRRSRAERVSYSRLAAVYQQAAQRDGLNDRQLSHPTQMTNRFGLIMRWLTGLFFSPVNFPAKVDTTIAQCARDGVAVYVLQTESLLDALYFNFALLRGHLPLAEFSNGPSMVSFLPWRRALKLRWGRRKDSKDQLSDGDVMRALLRRRRSILLFLRRGFTFTQLAASPPTDLHLADLISTQEEVDFPIFLIPKVLVWERQPSSDGSNILESFLGDPVAPGPLRKLASFLFNHRRAFVQVGDPVNLQTFLEEQRGHGEPAVVAESVREVVQQRFLRESRVFRGSRVKNPRAMADQIIDDPKFAARLRELMSEGQTEEQVRQEARSNLLEIAADLRLWMVDLFSLGLTLVWARIYTGLEVDTDGLERIREAARKAPIVIVPSHKSHIDYLVISYLFYRNGMIPPHIAAGANLSFWPLGWIFRRAGAFFLRRTFRGQPIYSAGFEAYVTQLLKENHWLEFFIEGTRSRSGKLLPPKYGLLRIILKAVADGIVPDVMIAPTNFGYERLIEEGAYRRELEGGEKKRESVGDLLGATRVLIHKYGRMRVQFAEPLSVKALLESEGISAGSLQEPEQFTRAVKVCGYQILGRINQAAVMTPTALTAAVLLTKVQRGINREDLLMRVGHLLDTAAQRGAVLAGPLQTAIHMRRKKLDFAETQDRVVEQQVGLPDPLGSQSSRAKALGETVEPFINGALEIFEEAGWVFRKRFDDDDEVFIVKRDGRLHLDYYKNNLIHLFVADALLASALLAGLDSKDKIDATTLEEDTKLLSRLLKYEFVYEPAIPFETQFQRTLNHFIDRKWLRQVDDNTLQLSSRLKPLVRLYAKLVQNFIESYLVLGRALPSLGAAPMTAKAFVAHCQKAADKQFELGEVYCHEAVSKVNLGNALRIFVEEGFVEERMEISGKRNVKMLRVESGRQTAVQFAVFVKRIELFHEPWRGPVGN